MTDSIPTPAPIKYETMDEAYRKSQRKINDAKRKLSAHESGLVRIDPAERERLERVIISEQWAWN